VNVIEFAPETIYVLGEVRNPKSVALTPGMSILQALAEAGGPLQTGNLGSVVLMRRVDDERAYAQRIDLQEMLSGNLSAFDMYLQPYDIVYVPKTFIARINQFVEQFFENMIWAPVFYLRTWEAFHTGDLYSIGNVARGGASQ
jgi:protein involved in polysaccharide export with SLBB domain